MARRGGGSCTVNFYREVCQTAHGHDLSACDDGCDIKEFEYLVTGYVSAYVPAKTYGPPENCYPAEGGEVEDITVTLSGEDVDLNDFSQKDQDRMIEQLAEAAADDDGGYDESERDYDDDGPPDSWDPPDHDGY